MNQIKRIARNSIINQKTITRLFSLEKNKAIMREEFKELKRPLDFPNFLFVYATSPKKGQKHN